MPRGWCRTAPAALLAVALLGLPAGAAGAQPAGPAQAAADLPRLHAELEQVTAEATRLADALEAEAARDGGLRVELQRLADQQEQAQARVDARARQAYIRTVPDPISALVAGLAADPLRAHARQELARRGAAAAVQAERELVTAVEERAAATAELQERAAAFRAELRESAAAVLAAQDRARALLAEAERALAARQHAVSADIAARLAPDPAARLAGVRASLDQVSATVTRTLTPAQTRRSQAAQRREAPVLALVEAAGSGYPAGWAPTGQVLRGEASWYGPGFVGNPTASGAPYDPERLTCAHKTLPLGTVVRVRRGPLAVSCLVNDRGPYAGDRILDLSRAGSRALGFDGVADVTVEVLAPVG